ncbi:MAG TPA: bifunctional serine/threonine-protein kinase/universal stress protein [Anaeromyxobacteraceae bacterium]
MGSLLEPGAVVDGFRIEERIHAGGMGMIYRVTGPEAGPPLIMKVPRLGEGEPAETFLPYEVEQMVLGALRGPHVPRLVASGDLAVQPYLVMERVEGASLSRWVERAPLPPEEIARVGAAVATALHDLHGQEAIHLDVQPANVLLRPSGEAVLLDFGRSRHANYPDLLAEELRRPIGSAPYIAPEQVLGVRSDPRSDIFALGVILYQLGTGRLPFGAPTTLGGLRSRLFRDALPPRALVRSLPEWLQEVILHCLEPDPERRYGSAALAAFDLSHPDQVAVTERGRRTRRGGFAAVLKRWIRVVGFQPGPEARPSAHLSKAPIVLAAIATAHTDEAQFRALRRAVTRLLSLDPHARLACVTVIRPSADVGSTAEDQHAATHIRHLVLLRHWAEPLHLPPEKISFHVLVSGDAAGALLEYARANQVDHLVIGTPPPDVPLRALLGTVATKVVAEAPCTVTVVRSRDGA